MTVTAPPATPATASPAVEIDRPTVLLAVSELVSTATGVSPVAGPDNIFDLGIESRALVEVKEALHDRFGVTVKFSDFFTHFTVDDLVDLVVARADEGGPR